MLWCVTGTHGPVLSCFEVFDAAVKHVPPYRSDTTSSYAHAHYIPLRSFYPLIWQLPTDVRQLGFNDKAVVLICLCSLCSL